MILTVDEMREHISSSLSDDALRDVMEAAEADIDAAAGTSGAAITEYRPGGYETLVLAYPAGTISSVTESTDDTPLVLAANDYRVSGYILTRLSTGTNPAYAWDGLVTVVHTPPDIEAARRRAQVALVRLELTTASGVSSEHIGDYSVSYSGGFKGPSYQEQRVAILAPLQPVMVA